MTQLNLFASTLPYMVEDSYSTGKPRLFGRDFRDDYLCGDAIIECLDAPDYVPAGSVRGYDLSALVFGMWSVPSSREFL